MRSRFDEAVAIFEKIHREDPRTILSGGRPLPFAVYYHRRLAHWVRELSPDPSEALRLSAHCQHLKRWSIPRTRFAGDRTGYRQWRRRLAKFHALKASRILRSVGYDEPTIARVADFLQKRRLRADPEVQLFEDAICLTFLENEFAGFAERKDEEQVISILKKTWHKMSEQGHRYARGVLDKQPSKAQSLLRKALENLD